MLGQLQLNQVLFLDIETVPEHKNFEDLSPTKQKLWEEKSAYKRRYEAIENEEISASEYYKNAGIWAEFGKIICISAGFINTENKQIEFRIKSFYGHEEKEILEDFSSLLYTHYNTSKRLLCGHNIKEFDIPYIARRLLIQGKPLPKILNLMGKKPWEVPHLDTLELWKFGDYKHFTSLKLLTEILGIESPKDDIDGSQVRSVYYEENNLERIVKYCEKDVIAVAQVVLKLAGKPLLKPEQTTYL
ncbi:3'-5' exonuclease [Mesohalobacter halotolerans]|uniref:3'-5' exonuclease n=1 Tax=Mesohalobacter halotolerans TaxID=1883405 RepID=A0A4V6ALH2_9FLAO|nr:3'-5' exonuclease [Mesohalobacter halotolerans]MBS3738439.1 3'-5' exonuclease [Psychroflexus sp.]TKS56865.1 3'-5' exonuclease [Mesohalobacter halotolerans]